MKTLQRTASVALVMALVAIPSTAFALDDVSTETGRETDLELTDRPSDRPVRDLSGIKARALEVIDRQLEALGRLRSKIANADHITAEHAGQLLGDIGTAASGLESLARQIESATTLAELRDLIEHIGDYKIQHVLAPKTFEVIASDTLVFATGKLERYADKLAEIIARFEEAGFDVDEAWRLLEQGTDSISEAYRLASPVAGNVIGLQARDWPEPAQAILEAGRADLGAARQNVRAAHADGKKIVEFLRGLVNGSDAATDVARADLAPTDAPASVG